MTVYDKTEWHEEGAAGLEKPGNHIALFMAWAVTRSLESDLHRENAKDELAALRGRKINAAEFFGKICAGRLWDEDLGEEGNAFAKHYYEKFYIGDYCHLAEKSFRAHENDGDFAGSWEWCEQVQKMLDEQFVYWKGVVLGKLYDRIRRYETWEDWPKDLPATRARTYIGMFLCWAIGNNLLSEQRRAASADSVAAVRARKMTGGEFLAKECKDEFWQDDLNDEGNGFAWDYYSDFYPEDYDELFLRGGRLPTVFHLEDSWENFDKISALLDRRFAEWKSEQEKIMSKRTIN
jgi:hypothetical protein